ncbi:MAG: hypothetical protein KAW12_04545 [Candidatus Aminicenantes bacterium]|nr:hypothetical protein [Candidatus Aminicenantes bacterium]
MLNGKTLNVQGLAAFSRRNVKYFIAAAAAIILCIIGWEIFRFLTDDAYIAFRYISNRQMGFGYTWNFPPFRAVEGYTCFSWIVLLDIVWSVTGITPPQAANFLSLVFSILSILITIVIISKLYKRYNEKKGVLLLGFALLWIVTNRTFLMWTSSGLETALFNFLIHAWILAGMLFKENPAKYTGRLALTAALLYLTRPGGLLFAFFTVLMVIAVYYRPGLARAENSGSKKSAGWLLRLLPLLIIPVHFIWRRLTYGEWLPNSYYAKYSSPWPQSGVRYLLSFMLEYFLWVWLIVILVVFLKKWMTSAAHEGRLSKQKSVSLNRSFGSPEPFFKRVLAAGGRYVLFFQVAAICLHLGYYTFIIGGDHFEYRIYSYLIPLIAISFVWAVLELKIPSKRSFILLLVFFLLSVQIPWIHWGVSQEKKTRAETYKMTIPVAEHVSVVLRPYVRIFDNLQTWLIDHYVCMRHREHKMLMEHLKSFLPPREVGRDFLPGEENPVVYSHCAGLSSWVFPRLNIIDYFGLNDYVIARTPLERGKKREMAHDRKPPPGYIKALQPNLIIRMEGKIELYKRKAPLSDEEVRSIEKRFIQIP